MEQGLGCDDGARPITQGASVHTNEAAETLKASML